MTGVARFQNIYKTANLKLYACRTEINDKHIVININVIKLLYYYIYAYCHCLLHFFVSARRTP